MLQATSTLLVLVLAALALVCSLVVAQGQRDETVRAEAILVLSTTRPSDAHLQHTIQLYRSGHATRILLVGHKVQEYAETIVGLHEPGDVVLPIETSGNRRDDLRNAAYQMARYDLQRVLLVDTPEAMLRDLKMAHDLGITAYGSPLPGVAMETRAVLQASLDYWNYVLFYGHTPVL